MFLHQSIDQADDWVGGEEGSSPSSESSDSGLSSSDEAFGGSAYRRRGSGGGGLPDYDDYDDGFFLGHLEQVLTCTLSCISQALFLLLR